MTPDSLSSVGLFRVPGEKSQIDYFKNQFNEGIEVNFSSCSAYDVAGLFKDFFKSLPDKLIPPFYNEQVPFIIA
uniref:Rho-GAP domain-containing protein n=1 Tax=Arcella intermedia TaxID=1963864 RepID=A0A6B2LU16_9EUKA